MEDSSHGGLIREVNVITVIEADMWKSGEAPVTYGTDKGSVSAVNCDVDTSETCWCKVATKVILTHSVSAVPLLSTHQSICPWLNSNVHPLGGSLDLTLRSRPMKILK